MAKVTKKDLTAMVDEAAMLDEKIKEAEKALKISSKRRDEIKGILKQYSQEKGVMEVEGKDYKYVFTAQSEKTIEPEDLVAFCKKNKESMLGLLKVNITDTVKRFGEGVLSAAGILSINHNVYARSKFVKK